MKDVVTLHAIEGKDLSVTVYRGYGTLCDLARISRPDEYDQVSNPRGTQRNLDVGHAKKAYQYALNASDQEKRMWPEIVLNIRRKKGIKIKALSKTKGGHSFVKIQFQLDELELKDINPSISRVDGNHRLYLAAGDQKRKLKPLTAIAPFAIAEGLSPEDELRIFRDINNEQRRMNTSHLDNILYRLTSEDQIYAKKRHLWLAQQLSKRDSSPFVSKVYLGGRKQKGAYLITLRGIQSAVKELLATSQLLETLPDAEKIYKLVENYWNAVKLVWPTEWLDSKQYKLMTNTPGLSALGRIGGKLLDIQLRKHQVKVSELQVAIAQVRPLINWHKESDDMRGMAGPGAAKRVASLLETGLPSEVDVESIEV